MDGSVPGSNRKADGGGDGDGAADRKYREKTSNFYKTQDLPARFEYPSLQDYGQVRRDSPNPFYITTYNDYGHFSPTVHTVSKCYRALSQRFGQEQYIRGMYRDHSLNM